MAAYYNEIDPYAAAWLRNLIAAGHIAPGEVDERSIVDVQATDLIGFTQCHFFAGIGGWSYALRLAGWRDDRQIWTGSCPCQPLSVAGLGKGHADERHLWPAFYGLIAECGPPVVFGEQVAGQAGREWFAGVRADLEVSGYACGAADLCAASVQAPHSRQRLYWLADTGSSDASGFIQQRDGLRRITSAAPAEHGNGSIHSGFRDLSNPNSIVAADGVSRPVGIVRAFGNAIVPQVAAEFIGAYLDVDLELAA